MSARHERIRDERLFYCFVHFEHIRDEKPLVFVVPAEVVAKVLNASHKKWLATPGRSGQKHKDSSIRKFLPSYSHIFGDEQQSFGEGWLDRYRDNWSNSAGAISTTGCDRNYGTRKVRPESRVAFHGINSS
jgi:hypothetical protein